jgi:Cu2+-exporting ATPase
MDKVREDATKAVRDLQRRGIRVEMLTGDNKETAKVIAEKLKVDGFEANLLP